MDESEPVSERSLKRNGEGGNVGKEQGKGMFEGGRYKEGINKEDQGGKERNDEGDG